MNFKKVLFLSLFVCLVACLGGCTKRDRLVDNTMILQIEPAGSIFTHVGDLCELSAIIRNVKMEEVDHSVRWSVTPSDLGSFFDSDTSKNVAFMASRVGEGKINLSCQGMTTSVDVTVS